MQIQSNRNSIDTDGFVARSFLYAKLSNDLEQLIRSGVYRTGEKLPSIRQLQADRSLSLATVTRALAELEARGLIEPKPRSGYYVAFDRGLPEPNLQTHRMRPRKVPSPHLADDFVGASADKRMAPLGGAVLSPSLLPLKHLSRLAREVAAKGERTFATYGPPSGALALRRQIAKRLLRIGVTVSADDVVVTSGCMNAIQLALLAATKPGDTVALESPTFFGFLQAVRDLGLYALEVPTDPKLGIDLESLEKALKKHDVKALIVTPTFQNPTGAAMPDEHKIALSALARRHEVTVIEDDVYGDLPFTDKRPAPMTHFADCDVIYCSSFSKTLAPGLRIGFIIPFRHLERVKRLKLSGTIASPALNQLVVAEFLKSGAYGRHLRGLRGRLKKQVTTLRQALAQHLPEGSEVTSPDGGFLLWVRLPPSVNTLALYAEMKRRRVSVLPGPLCAVDEKYANYLRISAGHPWRKQLDRAVRILGEEAAR